MERTKDGNPGFFQEEEILELVSEYIFEKRGRRVRIAPSRNSLEFMMSNQMQNCALKHFYEKFKPKEE